MKSIQNIYGKSHPIFYWVMSFSERDVLTLLDTYFQFFVTFFNKDTRNSICISLDLCLVTVLVITEKAKGGRILTTFWDKTWSVGTHNYKTNLKISGFIANWVMKSFKRPFQCLRTPAVDIRDPLWYLDDSMRTTGPPITCCTYLE